MNQILRRRRAAMSQKKQHNPLIYSLYNEAVAAGTRINTQICPWKSGESMTILLDFNMTTNPTSGYGRVWRLIQLWHAGINNNLISIGKKNASASIQTCYYMGVENGMSGSSTSVGRHRYCITHEADSDTLNIQYRKDTGTKRSYSFTQTFSEAPGNYLYFGGATNGDNSLPPGTITKAEVYDVVLDSTAINAFFS